MKKFYPLLIILIIIFGIIFIREAKKTKDISVKRVDTPILSKNQIYIPIYKEDKILGNPGAPVTIIEFTDFNCKKCSQVHTEIANYVIQNPSKVRLVWKGFAKNKIFTGADYSPHTALHCAEAQNQFWPFANEAMADSRLTNSDVDKIAQKLKLNQNSWLTCKTISSNSTASSTAIADQYGIKTLPAIFINNYYVNLDEKISVTDLLKKFVK